MTGRTVLVVDDDPDIREITQLSMQVMGGWEVLGASGGAEALELALCHRPDAVLLDVMMPGMDGPTTFRHLQADPRTSAIPVVLLTAKTQAGDAQVWDGLAVAGVISKPFNPATLPAEVDALIERQSEATRRSA